MNLDVESCASCRHWKSEGERRHGLCTVDPPTINVELARSLNRPLDAGFYPRTTAHTPACDCHELPGEECCDGAILPIRPRQLTEGAPWAPADCVCLN